MLEGLSYRPFHGPTKSTSPSRPNLATLVRRPRAQRSVRSSTAAASRLCGHWARPRHRGLGGSPRASVARVGTTTTAVQAGAAATDGPSNRQFVRYAGCMRSHGVLNFPDDPAHPSSGP